VPVAVNLLKTRLGVADNLFNTHPGRFLLRHLDAVRPSHAPDGRATGHHGGQDHGHHHRHLVFSRRRYHNRRGGRHVLHHATRRIRGGEVREKEKTIPRRRRNVRTDGLGTRNRGDR